MIKIQQLFRIKTVGWKAPQQRRKRTLSDLTDARTESSAVVGEGGKGLKRSYWRPCSSQHGDPKRRNKAWRSEGNEKLLIVADTAAKVENPIKFTDKLLKQVSLVMLLDQSQHPTFNYIYTCWQIEFQEEILEKMPFITSSLKKNKNPTRWDVYPENSANSTERN